MRGRKPKPTALKLIEGNPGRRPLPENEPEPPPPANLDPPPGLAAEAAEVWHYLAPILSTMGVFSVADTVALVSLCECWAELQRLRVVMAGYDGTTYETSNRDGATMIRGRPEVAQIADLDRRLRGWLSDFGLTPAARSRVQVHPPGEGDTDERFFRSQP